MTSLSKFFGKCQRCGSHVTHKSALAINLWAEDGKLCHDVVWSTNITGNKMLMHMHGDPECKSIISGYIGKILKYLELPASCNTSEIEKM